MVAEGAQQDGSHGHGRGGRSLKKSDDMMPAHDLSRHGSRWDDLK